jgi:hypothetical protein
MRNPCDHRNIVTVHGFRGSGFKGSEVQGFIWFLKSILEEFSERSVSFDHLQSETWHFPGNYVAKPAFVARILGL